MEMPSAVLFWGAVVLLGYALAGYPLLVRGLAHLRRCTPRTAPDYAPAVSMVIAVHRGADIMRAKMENCRALEYPPGKLEILVGIDGGDAGIEAVLAGLQDGNVRWDRIPERVGKAAVLNRLIPQARGAVLVFSDADTMYAPDAVRRLVQPLADPGVAVTCGRLELVQGDCSTEGGWERVYWHWENRLKGWESRAGSVVSATGGIYAMRRELFAPLPAATAVPDDLLLAVTAMRQGGRMVFAPDAVGREGAPGSVSTTFARRVRIAEQNFRVLRHLRPFLAPRRGFLALGLWSHKVLRWFAPFLLLALLAGSVGLRDHPVHGALLVLQIGWYGLGACGLLSHAAGRPVRALGLPCYFLLGGAALLIGCLRSLVCPPQLWWESTESRA